MNPIRCLLVDDERLARQVLNDLLAAHEDFQVIGEAADISEAARLYHLHRPDVIFLDIQMPGGDGFGLLEVMMPDPPHVVFITAHDRYALRAFEINALDYLHKPVRPQRLATTLQRLRERVLAPDAATLPEPDLPRLGNGDRLFLKVGRSGCFVPVAEILHVTGHGNQTSVQLRNGRRFAVRVTLASWMERLPADGFVQLDRSCIVQWSQIRHADLTSLRAVLQFDVPESTLTLGRPAAQRLRQLLARGKT